MRRGSEAGGQSSKGRRNKPLTSKAGNPSKALRTRSSRAGGEESEIARLSRELDEALKRQAATSEVLRVIRSSHDNLRAVFEAVAENSVRLCDADRAFIFQFDGELLRMVVAHNASPELAE